ncbi:MAG: efflux RND transporter periplasmic adaptor subunit [Firmicutes bacterium]|nr:efflux RND transporter periplasmic adaptor subunit [Bacillota bacterium]
MTKVGGRLPSRKALIIGVVALLLVGMVWMNLYRIKNPPGVAVTTGIAEKKKMQTTVIADGRVRVKNPEVIYAVTGGKINKVLVQVGQEVGPGEVLAQIDDEQLLMTVAQQESALTLAEANEQKTRTSTRVNEVAQAEANLAQFEASRDNAKQKLDSLETLYQAGAASKQDLDAARLDYELKQSQYELAVEQLPAARAGSEASLRASAAQTEQARAALDQARYKLEHATIRTVNGGRVLRLEIKPGDMVLQDQALVTLGSLSELEIEAEVSEVDAGRLRVGQAVEITSAASEKAKQKGTLTAIAPQAVIRVKNGGEQTVVPVTVTVEGENRLIPGTNADVEITTGLEESALVIPYEALVEKDEGPQVFVVKDRIARLCKVTVGLSDESQVQILDGIAEGDQVVLNPSEEVKDGVAVKVEPTKLD